MANALASALSTAASFARADPSRRHLGVSPSRSGASAFLGRALPCLSRRRPGRKSCEPPRRPAAVLGSREASGLGEQDPDGIVWDTQKYTWRVGGPNDIPCVHLRDVYRGEKPLTPIPSPFCTKSSCPVTIGDRVLQFSESEGLSCFDALPLNAPQGRRLWSNPNIRGEIVTALGNDILVWNEDRHILARIDSDRGDLKSSITLPMVSMVKASRDAQGDLLLIAASNDGRLQLLESKN